MKHCPRCERDLPLSEFGVCRARKDGMNLYCRSCIREKVRNFRQERRDYGQSVKPVVVNRKPSVTARLWLTPLSPKDKVLVAITRGAKTQTDIRHATRLDEDALTDALADLYVENRLNRQALKQRMYVAA